MSNPGLSEEEMRQAWRAFHEIGTVSGAARSLGLHRPTYRNRLNRAVEILGPDVTRPHVGGSVEGNVARQEPLPPPGLTKRYFFTCAQSNTRIAPSWENVKILADTLGAQVMVSRFTYNKLAYGERAVKPDGGANHEDEQSLWFAPEVLPYVSDEKVQIAPGLVWCGHLQIIPTAELPLSGLENYCGRKSLVVPHPNISLQSVPSAKELAPKLMYSTGCVTQKNYIQMKTGQRAEGRHCYGGLIVEVEPDGSWWARQVEVKQDGSVQDLDVLVQNGKVRKGEIAAIVYGDLHAARVDQTVVDVTWGETGIAGVLKPKVQVFHDVLDFHARGHHEIRNPHKMFEKFQRGQDSVEDELCATASLLKHVFRKDALNVVVSSNHDRHMDRWLCEADYRYDPTNALVFLQLQAEKYRRIANREEQDIVPWALTERGSPKEMRWLRRDESYIVEGVELGMHGDDGPNGARGNINLFAKQGRATVTMHAHGIAIRHQSYQGGTSSKLDMGYNHGQSSWSHSHVIVYPGGTRTVITLWHGKWRGSN